MKEFVPECGAVVRSKAGRDAGRCFVVLKTEGGRYAWLADGTLRKVQNPKKKKYMHLDVLPCRAEGIRELTEAGRLTDADVRKALKASGMESPKEDA